MAWTDLTFAYLSILTSAKMTALDANLDALAAGSSGAPRIQDAALASAKGGANGLASLNASSLVVQEPASKAQASGIASLNSSSKVVQALAAQSAFRISSSTQSGLTGGNSPHKVVFDTEDFDTGNMVSSSRFTPTVAGKYQINAAVYATPTTSFSVLMLMIYKNGAVHTQVTADPDSFSSGSMLISDIVSLNGSTDYIEIFVAATVASLGTYDVSGGTAIQYFSGGWICP